MPIYVALLRAVNVGGTGKLPMAELRALCEDLGFTQVRTYIQSGNVVFGSAHSSDAAKSLLEARLEAYAGKPVAVVLRSAKALAALRDSAPFPDAAPNKVLVLFSDRPEAGDPAAKAKRQTDEQIAQAGGEIFIHFPSGMGRSRLWLPQMDHGTARNLNTVARLAKMAQDAEG